MAERSGTESPSHSAIPLRHVAAVVVGNGLEFYDFLTYSLFAIYIGHAFFPSGRSSLSLLLSLATFGIGFVTRPIGAIFLGGLGDRVGRKPAMLLSFLLMGVGMLGMALTPTRAEIGLAAPILVICFRLIQGFALGGEVGPTTAYLIEAAPASRRGLYGSMQYMSQDMSLVLASLVGVALSASLSHAQLEAWGWRVAFGLGVAIVPFGIWIRSRLPETLHAPDDALLAPDATKGSISISRNGKGRLRLAILGLVMLASGTIGTYVTNYMTTFALDTLHLAPGIAFGVTLVTSLVAIVIEPLTGGLSDHFGRRVFLIVPAIITLPAIIPAFWLITHYPSPWIFYATMGLLNVPFTMAQVTVIVALTELLPKKIRSGAVATIYAFAISIFGGSTQFVVTWLIKATGNPMAPGYYWSIALLISLVARLMMPESAPRKLAEREISGGLEPTPAE